MDSNKLEIMLSRHAVRSYMDTPIQKKTIDQLMQSVNIYNSKANLHIQLVTNNQKAFSGILAHYGKFRGVNNYFAMVGKKDELLEEKVGYYGEKLVLQAQKLGLNTCWVAVTYKKRKCQISIEKNETLVCLIALGYGTTQGVPHKSRDMNKLCSVEGEMPTWFLEGMQAAMLAPTAMNQQRFLFSLVDDQVGLKALKGSYSKIDLGIVKYHFELGSEKKL